jgi:glutathione S-transferase
VSTTVEVLYFDIRGRAEPIRLLLEDVGVAYEDKQISLEEWPAIRETTPFRRLPVYTAGDVQIPESFAIMNHLGREHGLLGEDEAARIRCDVTVEAWRDYGNRVANTFGALSKSEADRRAFLETEQPALLADLEAYYLARGTDAPYWAGTAPTIADFAAFHLLEGVANQLPELMVRFGALKEFHDAFAERPRIKAYLTSPRRPAALFYGPDGKIYPRRR